MSIRPTTTVHPAHTSPTAQSPAGRPEADATRSRAKDSKPLDWNLAVRAAGTLLDERFGPPGSAGDPIVSEMAHDLAARLCAYDEAVRTADHMHTHQHSAPTKK